MSEESSKPDFGAFTRWVASHYSASAFEQTLARRDALLSAARIARDANLRTQNTSHDVPSGPLEVLHLMAAASMEVNARPPELTTARGFRVTLSYDDTSSDENGGTTGSICVLVRCPPELISALLGHTAFLWNGAERFELGEFDVEGKALGTLPAGIEISASDFAQGRVKLEEPPESG